MLLYFNGFSTFRNFLNSVISCWRVLKTLERGRCNASVFIWIHSSNIFMFCSYSVLISSIWRSSVTNWESRKKYFDMKIIKIKKSFKFKVKVFIQSLISGSFITISENNENPKNVNSIFSKLETWLTKKRIKSPLRDVFHQFSHSSSLQNIDTLTQHTP